MNSSNLLIGIGLFVCAAGIILIALVAWAARTLTKDRTNRPNNMDSWKHYNDPNIESKAGFGNVPNTGSSYPPAGSIIGSSGFGGVQTANPDESSDKNGNHPNERDETASSGEAGHG